MQNHFLKTILLVVSLSTCVFAQEPRAQWDKEADIITIDEKKFEKDFFSNGYYFDEDTFQGSPEAQNLAKDYARKRTWATSLFWTGVLLPFAYVAATSPNSQWYWTLACATPLAGSIYFFYKSNQLLTMTLQIYNQSPGGKPKKATPTQKIPISVDNRSFSPGLALRLSF